MPTPNPADYNAWDPTKVYNTGDYVEWSGGLYQANFYSLDVNPLADAPDVGGPTGYWTTVVAPVYTPVAPMAPTGLKSGYTSSSSVALFWDAAKVMGIGDVSRYDIYQGNTKVGTSTTTSFTVNGLDPSKSYTFSVDAVDSTGISGKSTGLTVSTDAVVPSSGKYFSPYIDMTLPGTDVAALSQASGLRDFTLGFMQSTLGNKQAPAGTPGASGLTDHGDYANDGSVPTVSWGGVGVNPAGLPLLDDSAIIQQVKKVEAEGGTVTISFGGYTGRDPAVVAREYEDYLKSPSGGKSADLAHSMALSNLQAEYQSAIDTYGVNALDFDVETDAVPYYKWVPGPGGYGWQRQFLTQDGQNTTEQGAYRWKDDGTNGTLGVLTDTRANTLRDQAIVGLQQQNPGLKISLTVAVTQAGLNQEAYNMLAQAKADGVRIDTVNIMAMDYGGPVADMGTAAIIAAKDVEMQLTTGGTFNGVTYAGLGLTSTKVGITPMLGNNDVAGETFTTEDAQQVLAFAASNPWVAGMGMWQLPRDNSATSGVTQSDYQFSHMLERLETATGAYAKVGDFNGDRTSDILLRNNANGALGYDQMNSNGTATWHVLGGSAANYSAAGTADFNGDGVADILLRGNGNVGLGYDQVNGNGTVTWHALGGVATSLAVKGIGDFNGDGAADILFRNDSTGALSYDQVGGSTPGLHAIGGSSTVYSVVGVGDFNDDGVSDILMRNNANGAVGYDKMNSNGTATWTVMGNTPSGYSVAGVADFNNDGTSDILLRANNSSHDTGYEQVSSTGTYTWHDLGALLPTSSVVGTGDYNGDGMADILFRNSTTGAMSYEQIAGASPGLHTIGGSAPSYST